MEGNVEMVNLAYGDKNVNVDEFHRHTLVGPSLFVYRKLNEALARRSGAGIFLA
jgi:hypothetical protein